MTTSSQNLSCEKLDVEEVNMTATIASSGLANLGPDKTLSEYTRSLPS